MPARESGRGPLTGSRTKARRAAIELLFEADQRGVHAGELARGRVVSPVTDAPLRPYTIALVEGVVDRWAAVNELLGTYSQGWALDRMPAVDRAILRMATWEIVWNDDVPDGVAVSEGVELARALSTDESPTFVGGLLSRIAEVKPTLDLSDVNPTTDVAEASATAEATDVNPTTDVAEASATADATDANPTTDKTDG